MWIVRVHEFVAREISLLQSKYQSVRCSTSPVQPLQTYMERARKETGKQAVARFARVFGSSLGTRPNLEESGTARGPYASSDGAPLSSGSAAVCVPTSPFALAHRTLGFGVGRTLLPLWRKRLGFVCDGNQAVPSQSSRLPRPCSFAGQRKHAGLVSGIHNDSCLHPKTHPGYGLRRDSRNYQARHEPGLDRAVLSFPSHQPIAELPRPKKSQIAGQSFARSALSTCPPSSRSARWSQVRNRAQKTEASDSPGNRTARHGHDRSGISQTDRPFQSLSEIPRTRSAHNHRQCRSYEPKSS